MNIKPIKSVINTIEKTYPQDNELVVTFYKDIPMGVAEVLQDESISDYKRSVVFITHIVCDWNFGDEQGNKLPITEDSVNLLGANLVKWIIEEASEIIKPNEDKKKS